MQQHLAVILAAGKLVLGIVELGRLAASTAKLRLLDGEPIVLKVLDHLLSGKGLRAQRVELGVLQLVGLDARHRRVLLRRRLGLTLGADDLGRAAVELEGRDVAAFGIVRGADVLAAAGAAVAAAAGGRVQAPAGPRVDVGDASQQGALVARDHEGALGSAARGLADVGIVRIERAAVADGTLDLRRILQDDGDATALGNPAVVALRAKLVEPLRLRLLVVLRAQNAFRKRPRVRLAQLQVNRDDAAACVGGDELAAFVLVTLTVVVLGVHRRVLRVACEPRAVPADLELREVDVLRRAVIPPLGGAAPLLERLLALGAADLMRDHEGATCVDVTAAGVVDVAVVAVATAIAGGRLDLRPVIVVRVQRDDLLALVGMRADLVLVVVGLVPRYRRAASVENSVVAVGQQDVPRLGRQGERKSETVRAVVGLGLVVLRLAVDHQRVRDAGVNRHHGSALLELALEPSDLMRRRLQVRVRRQPRGGAAVEVTLLLQLAPVLVAAGAEAREVVLGDVIQPKGFARLVDRLAVAEPLLEIGVALGRARRCDHACTRRLVGFPCCAGVRVELAVLFGVGSERQRLGRDHHRATNRLRLLVERLAAEGQLVSHSTSASVSCARSLSRAHAAPRARSSRAPAPSWSSSGRRPASGWPPAGSPAVRGRGSRLP